MFYHEHLFLNMPKIVLGVSSSFCANFLKGQVNFLVKKGYEVIIISGAGEEITTLATKEHATLITIPFTKKISPLTDLAQLIRLTRIIKKEKPTIVNAGNPKSGFLIMLACYFAGCKNRIFTLHGLLSDTKTGFVRWMITLTEKVSCRIARTVIVVSPSLQQHAEKRNILTSGKGLVIEKGSCNGIDMTVFSTTPVVQKQAKQLKEKLGIKDDHIVIGFVGRLSKDKGVDILFDAFNQLIQKYPFLRMVLAGPLLEENQFSAPAMHQLYHDDRVFYLGKIAEVAPVYALMDILALSSLREGFGNVLIEAAAMEVPVIAPDIPGCRDAVNRQVTGELFTKGDAKDLAMHLEKLILDPFLRHQYGKMGRQFVEENFSNFKIWDGQLKLYEAMQVTSNQ
jgi:glycosyltransferase involved in cell wall biosynthesis